jgi:predicted transposase/invertase (TIGR01784 family)
MAEENAIDISNDIPKLLPPSEDGVFKSLLTHPDAKPVLQDLISSVLQIPVRDAQIKNTEPHISDVKEKRERFDVNCVLDGGKQVDVEMQSEAMKGDSLSAGHVNIRDRAVYYLCDLHAAQPGRRIRYENLMRSYQITFCGYKVFPETERFINDFYLRSDTGLTLSRAVSVWFVELSKLGAAMKKPVAEMSPAAR